MPSRSSWKSHTSLLLSRLGSKRAAAAAGGGSSLVIQAGFPTSLADLFVKNRSKILPKKSIKHKPVNLNPNPNPNPNLIPIHPPVIAVRSPSRVIPNSRKPRGLGLGLGFVAIVLGVLAVGKKWVVIGITIVSLFLLVLESFGFLEKKKKLEPVVRVVDLSGRGLVSPIREESSISETAHMGDNVSSEKSEISVESSDFDVNSTKKKKKKLFRKLFKKKCSRKKNDEEDNRLNEMQLIDEDGDDTDFLSFEDSDGVMEAKEAVAVGGKVDVNRLWRWRKFGFLVVVLFGLLGGKIVAVMLFMAWVLLSECSGTVWRKLKMERIILESEKHNVEFVKV